MFTICPSPLLPSSVAVTTTSVSLFTKFRMHRSFLLCGGLAMRSNFNAVVRCMERRSNMLHNSCMSSIVRDLIYQFQSQGEELSGNLVAGRISRVWSDSAGRRNHCHGARAGKRRWPKAATSSEGPWKGLFIRTTKHLYTLRNITSWQVVE
jgi:hypothetical protein